MDFFEHQDRSRRKSRWLVGAFLLAVLAIVAAVDLVVVSFFGTGGTAGNLCEVLRANASMLAFATVITASAILGASLFRIAQLREGGGVVARSVGAVELPDNPEDLRLRRLRNVVEETALASGLPVPELFVLEQESGINAFAAGHTPADAAVAVTRGTLERLTRNELQGVIAHEFSHIANGDMRLNLRLMGWLFGILVIAIAGRGILRAGMHGGGRRKGSGLAIFGVTLLAVGYVGVFAGRVIKAAVSRERERLADASAVQFTRDVDGLAGALKKIGGLEGGSRIRFSEAEEVSHMLFAEGLANRLLATHPPLVERIRALEPDFDPGQFAEVSKSLESSPEPDATGGGMPRFSGLSPARFAAAAGAPGDAQYRSGAGLRKAIPEALYRDVHRERGALQVVVALMLSRDDAVRDRQARVLADWLGERDIRQTLHHAETLWELSPSLRLPLTELAWPRLRRLPPEELARLARSLEELARADDRIEVFEYVLARCVRVLIRNRADVRERPRIKLAQCRAELADLFSVLARAGHEGELQVRRAYEAGLSELFPRRRPEYRAPAEWHSALDRSLDRLDALPSVIKGELLRALAVTVSHDGIVAASEAELLRAISSSLHCPIPPLPFSD